MSLYASEQPLVARQSLIDMAWGKSIGPHSGRYVLTIWQECLCMRRSNARRTTKFNRHGLGKEFQVIWLGFSAGIKCLKDSLIMSSRRGSRSKRQRDYDDEFVDVAPSTPSAEYRMQPPPAHQHRHSDFTSSSDNVSFSQSFYTTPASPQKSRAMPASTSLDWITVSGAATDTEDSLPFDFMDPNFVYDLADITDEPRKRRRGQGDDPMKMWVPEADHFLQEFLRREGRGDFVEISTCPQCQTIITDGDITTYRCSDCQDERLLCRACIVKNHAALPYHRVSSWSGSSFEKTTLKDLGLRIQLGHPIGQPCVHPSPAFNDDFVVIAVNGVHSVGLDFCDCVSGIGKHRWMQLVRAGLYPATVTNPKSAATFDVMKTFQILSFMSKVSAYEYYHTLARLSDNTGTQAPSDRYHAFLRMIRQWRHLKMMKRGGRGHDPSGVAGTAEGECAVLCPACPYPDINLPENWEELPDEDSWLFTLFVAIDANFRLKRLTVSSDERDPGLNHGYAYVVEEKKFKSYLEKYDSIIVDDVSTCNDHDALKSASKRGGQGIASSGAGTVECSRHDMKRPISVGDLQKGERYVNMDYLYLSGLRHRKTPRRLVTSYDIACQWSRNIRQRINLYPPEMHPPHDDDDDMVFLIPKFHLPAHQASCRTGYSFNYTPLVGRTDGEAPERGWASINAVSTSTKEMGPGSRRDTLDDHFGDYNWRKVITMAETFLRKIKAAVEGKAEHAQAFSDFTDSLDPEVVEEWTEAVEAWEADNQETNPFVPTEKAATINKVRLALAQEDADVGSTTLQLHERVSPSLMVAQGIELEEQQRRLRFDARSLGQHATDIQRAKILERSNSLRRRIEAWTGVQELYVPSLVRLRARDAEEAAEASELPQAYAIDLLLPSAVIGRARCSLEIQEFEWRLRHAQAFEILEELRRHLLLRTQLYHFKDRFVHGQRYLTRSQKVIDGLQAKINADAARYRVTYTALLNLSTSLQKVGWQAELRVLAEADVRGLGANEQEGVTEGTRTVSWIWLAHGMGQDEKAKAEALRIEWCKARARARRWEEECSLLVEEMRRVLQFWKWEVDGWMGRAEGTGFEDMSPAAVEGRRAYAFRQAAIRMSLIAHCSRAWKDVPTYVLLGMEGSNVESA